MLKVSVQGRYNILPLIDTITTLVLFNNLLIIESNQTNS